MCTGHSMSARRVAVSGVAAGDVLNLRELPDPGAPIVATAVNGVEVLALGEVRVASDGARWELVEIPLLPGQVEEEEAMNGCGWVNTRFISDSSPDAPTVSTPSDPRAFLDAFLAAWESGDRGQMSRFASSSVFESFEGGDGRGLDADLAWDDTCLMGTSATGGCEVLVSGGPGSGPALIYWFEYGETNSDGDLTIWRIDFVGDAG